MDARCVNETLRLRRYLLLTNRSGNIVGTMVEVRVEVLFVDLAAKENQEDGAFIILD